MMRLITGYCTYTDEELQDSLKRVDDEITSCIRMDWSWDHLSKERKLIEQEIAARYCFLRGV